MDARYKGIVLEDKVGLLKKEIGAQMKRLLKDDGKFYLFKIPRAIILKRN